MISQDEARNRVALGAAYLDRTWPEWFNRIDVGTLTLHDSCGCIVGQLCGSNEFFSDGLARLGIAINKCGTPGQAFGLDLSRAELAGVDSKTDRMEAYRPLQDAWIEAIADRRLRSEQPQSTNAVDPVGRSDHELTPRV